MVRNRSATVWDHKPQIREPAKQVALHQLHEDGGVGIQVVGSGRMHAGITRGRNVDHRRYPEFGHGFVERVPVLVGNTRRTPVAPGWVRVQVASHET